MFNSEIKKYSLQLKHTIDNHCFNNKKRLIHFPIKTLIKVYKISLKDNAKVTFKDKEYTLNSLSKKSMDTYKELIRKSKNSYYHNTIKMFIKDSRKDKTTIQNNYKKYNKVLSEEFNKQKDSFIFCLDVLKVITKKYKEDNKNIKESVNFIKERNDKMQANELNAVISELYERCSLGDISIEERESLILEARNTEFIDEIFEDSYDDEYTEESALEKSNLSPKEKMDKIKDALYERCSLGEITITEREELLSLANDQIYGDLFNEAKKEIKKDDTQSDVDKEAIKAKRKKVAKTIALCITGIALCTTIVVLVNKLKKEQAKTKGLGSENNILKQSNASNERELKNLESERDTLQKQLSSSKKQYASLQNSTNKQLQQFKNNKDLDIKNKDSRIKELYNDNRNKEKRIKELNKNIKELSDNNSMLNTKLKNTELGLKDDRNLLASSQLDAIIGNVGKIQKELINNKSKCISIKNKLNNNGNTDDINKVDNIYKKTTENLDILKNINQRVKGLSMGGHGSIFKDNLPNTFKNASKIEDDYLDLDTASRLAKRHNKILSKFENTTVIDLEYDDNLFSEFVQLTDDPYKLADMIYESFDDDEVYTEAFNKKTLAKVIGAIAICGTIIVLINKAKKHTDSGKRKQLEKYYDQVVDIREAMKSRRDQIKKTKHLEMFKDPSVANRFNTMELDLVKDLSKLSQIQNNVTRMLNSSHIEYSDVKSTGKMVDIFKKVYGESTEDTDNFFNLDYLQESDDSLYTEEKIEINIDKETLKKLAKYAALCAFLIFIVRKLQKKFFADRRMRKDLQKTDKALYQCKREIMRCRNSRARSNSASDVEINMDDNAFIDNLFNQIDNIHNHIMNICKTKVDPEDYKDILREKEDFMIDFMRRMDINYDK